MSSNTADNIVAICATIMIATLVFIGWDMGVMLQLLVQTAPLWLVAVLGWRGGGYLRWAAVPMLGFWTVGGVMAVSDQLGLTHLTQSITSGMALRAAIVLTLIGLTGLAACCVRQPRISILTGVTLALACGAAQIGFFYFGMQSSFPF